jgi:hypothetical protein
MGDTGLELASGAPVGPDCPVLLGFSALRSAQVRSNCYQDRANRSTTIGSMTTRAQAAENALASVRAEGLDPGVAEARLHRWARGELSDSQLDDAARKISTGELLAPPGARPELVQRSRSSLSIRGAGNDRSHACCSSQPGASSQVERLPAFGEE